MSVQLQQLQVEDIKRLIIIGTAHICKTTIRYGRDKKKYQDVKELARKTSRLHNSIDRPLELTELSHLFFILFPTFAFNKL